MHFHYSKNLISHTHQTTPPIRRRWIYGVSRQTRMHTLIIDQQHNVLIYTSYKFISHHRSSTMGSFGFQYSEFVLNIEQTVADGFSNRIAHGPLKNEFTSHFYRLLRIITIRIVFVFFSGRKYKLFFLHRMVKYLHNYTYLIAGKAGFPNLRRQQKHR